MQTHRYMLDTATYGHLLAWCERYAPIAAEDRDETAERIAAYLEQQTEQEAAYLLAEGWPRVYAAAYSATQ